MPTIEKPMNPYAEEDFANAVKEAMKDVVEEVKHNYNEYPKDEYYSPQNVVDMIVPYVMRGGGTRYGARLTPPRAASLRPSRI